MINATRAQFANVLLLDAGNALWGQPLTMQTQGKVMVEAMNLLAYDAMLIGDLDLQLGSETLRERIADAEFPVLSANLMLAGADELLAEPYALLEVDERKVGIIGLTWDGAGVATDQYVLLKADDVLPEYVAKLQEEADIIIVLSNMGHEEDLRLASQVPGIDLIVSGRTRVPLPQALRSDGTGTLIVQAGSQGQWIGRRQLHLDSAGVVTQYVDELLLLTEQYAEDPQMLEFLNTYQ